MWRFAIFLLSCWCAKGLCASPNVTIQFCREFHPVAAQQWQYVRDDHTIRPLNSDLCLTTHPNRSQLISITPCVVGLNFYQVWQLDPQGGQLTDLTGKCLGVHFRKLFKPSVELTPCTGKNNQRWIWKDISGGSLQSRATWKSCLAAVI